MIEETIHIVEENIYSNYSVIQEKGEFEIIMHQKQKIKPLSSDIYIQTIELYKGTKYFDTCIVEIQVE